MVEVVPELHRVGCASITARRGGLVASMALHLGVSITRHPKRHFAHIELKASFMGDLDLGRGTPSMVACLFCPWNRYVLSRITIAISIDCQTDIHGYREGRTS